jgi:hypothetical protein
LSPSLRPVRRYQSHSNHYHQNSTSIMHRVNREFETGELKRTCSSPDPIARSFNIVNHHPASYSLFAMLYMSTTCFGWNVRGPNARARRIVITEFIAQEQATPVCRYSTVAVGHLDRGRGRRLVHGGFLTAAVAPVSTECLDRPHVVIMSQNTVV